MNPLLWADTLENIIIFLKNDTDLRSLIQVCKTTRNIVGHSNIWKKIDPSLELENCAKYVDATELFKLFVSIRLGSKQIKFTEPKHGQWYYLYVVKLWLRHDSSLSWKFLDLYRSQNDIEKICQLSNLALETKKASDYHDWTDMLPSVYSAIKIMSLDFSPEKIKMRDLILTSIHVNYQSYGNKTKSVMIGIREGRLKYKFESTIDSFLHRIKFKSERYLCRFEIANFDGNFRKINPDRTLIEMFEISKSINVDYEMFVEIIKIILGKDNNKCKNIVNSLFGDDEHPNFLSRQVHNSRSGVRFIPETEMIGMIKQLSAAD